VVETVIEEIAEINEPENGRNGDGL